MQIKQTSAKFRCWINNYIHIKLWAVNIHPCPNFNGGLVKPPLKPGNGWVIRSHRNQCMWLLIHVLISPHTIRIDNHCHNCHNIKSLLLAFCSISFAYAWQIGPFWQDTLDIWYVPLGPLPLVRAHCYGHGTNSLRLKQFNVCYIIVLLCLIITHSNISWYCLLHSHD